MATSDGALLTTPLLRLGTDCGRDTSGHEYGSVESEKHLGGAASGDREHQEIDKADSKCRYSQAIPLCARHPSARYPINNGQTDSGQLSRGVLNTRASSAIRSNLVGSPTAKIRAALQSSTLSPAVSPRIASKTPPRYTATISRLDVALSAENIERHCASAHRERRPFFGEA